MPKPSMNDENTLFLEANASALPSMIQLTTINGINNPKLAYNDGTYASITIWTMVTKDAMTTINAGIRTLSGINVLSNEMITFDKLNTNSVANPIPNPLIADVVTPKVGHIPSNNTKTGFSFINP